MEKDLDVASEPSRRILSGHAGPPPGQGPFISLKLTLLGEIIQSASYETYQCPGCQACGRAICEMVTGKKTGEASGIKHDDLLARVGPLPRHRRHCYGLAMLALNAALGHLADAEFQSRDSSSNGT